jgi:hypothetical protein
MKNLSSLQTVLTVANAAELTAAIAKEVLGNDVADSVEGSELTSDVVRDIAVAQIQQNLSTYNRSK